MSSRRVELSCQEEDTPHLKQGRDLYNFYCYYCHGYSGDARAVAARYLDPKPRNFKQEPALSADNIFQALKEGRPGTAMKTFSAHLSEDKMRAVADFVSHEFVKCKKNNTRYHTAEAGWPDHEKRYGAAFPFVTGELDPELEKSSLDEKQLQGLRLYRGACVSCHDLDVLRYGEEDKTSGIKKMPRIKDWQEYLNASNQLPEPKEFKPYRGYAGDNPELAAARAQAEYRSVSEHDEPPLPDNLSEQELLGEQLYQENCAACHAADGTGKNWIGGFLDPHPTDFTDKEIMKDMTRESFEKITRDGAVDTSMPAFKAVFSDDEIRAVAAYVERVFLKAGAE